METNLLRSSRIPDGILCSIIPFNEIRRPVPVDIVDSRARIAAKNTLYKTRPQDVT